MNPKDIPLTDIHDWFVYARKYVWIEHKYGISREQIEECIKRYVKETMNKG